MYKMLKNKLFSENGMSVINVLFFLTVLFRSSLFNCIVSLIWTIFLVFSIKRTQSKTMKVFYSILALFALTIIALNIYYGFINR